MSAHVSSLAALAAADEQRFGGKSASLGALIAAAIPVPLGFAVAISAFEAFLACDGLAERVDKALAGLDVEDVEALAAASRTVVEAMRATPIPAAVREQLERAYGELAAGAGEAAPPVAVRSSARGEDSAEATFAGQQETFLWVRGASAVVDAVRDCWASLYSPPAISYRARMGAAEEAPAMGVAVQQMVDAAVAGVLFTCSPLSGDRSVVAIDASWGLGLGVVGGEVTPDEYVVSKITGEVLRRTVNRKHVSFEPDPAGGGTVVVPVAAERQQEPCLDAEQLAALAELGQRVERHFGAPQDVEWAIARSGGEILVLQARPVTTAPARPAPAPPRGSALSLVMSTFGAGPRAAGERDG